MLFNGSNLDGWKCTKGDGTPKWKVEHGMMTVEPWSGSVTGNKRVRKGPLMLQDHCDKVSFRNVWVMPLE